MTRWAAIAFVVLCGAMFTGVLEPLQQGRNDAWLAFATPVAAVVGLAFAVRRWSVLLAPVLLIAVTVVAAGLDPLNLALAGIVGLPAMLAVAAVALLLARRVGRHARRVAIASFAVAALPLLWGTFDTVRRNLAPELPQEVIEQLPNDGSFGNLCPGAETPPDLSRRLRREAEVLFREVRAHPHSLVPFTYHWAHDSPDHEEITVRELAEEQLGDLENGGPDCAPDLQRRLREAL